MVRGFIVGNLIVGAVMAAANIAIFWKIGVPNALVIGIISGFMSLVPYLGVPWRRCLRWRLVLVAQHVTKIVIILVTVFLVHVLAMNFFSLKCWGQD